MDDPGAKEAKITPSLNTTEPKNIPVPVTADTQSIVVDLDKDTHTQLTALVDNPLNTTVEIVEPAETIEQQKKRIDALWSAWEEIQNDTELMTLFDRKNPLVPDRPIQDILAEHGYPPRTKITDLKFQNWVQYLDPRFCRDGFMYVLRGDYLNLDRNGFYTNAYSFAKQNTQQVSELLHAPQEAGYFTKHDERYLKTKPYSTSIAQQLAYEQSAAGGSTFISTTIDIPCAVAGTSNDPDPEEQNKYEVYVLKIPVDSLINSNTGNYFGMNEQEYLIPDCILPNEIVAKFPRTNTEGIYQYLHETLGINREDVGLKPLDAVE